MTNPLQIKGPHGRYLSSTSKQEQDFRKAFLDSFTEKDVQQLAGVLLAMALDEDNKYQFRACQLLHSVLTANGQAPGQSADPAPVFQPLCQMEH